MTTFANILNLQSFLKDNARQKEASYCVLFTLVLFSALWNDDKFWNIEVLDVT